MCCRQDFIGNGCDGTVGGGRRHQCVRDPNSGKRYRPGTFLFIILRERIYLILFKNTNFHFTPETPTNTPNKIENEGKECWDNCGRLQGSCPWCGSEGMCCRVANGNANRVGNGCDGYIGGRNRHECTLASGGTGGNNVAKIYDSNFLIKFFSTFLRSYKSNYMTF